MSGTSGKQDRTSAEGRREGLKPIPQRTYRKVVLWEDLRDIVMTQIDVLLVLMIVMVVAFPIMWLIVGDVALLAGYAALFSFASIVVFYMAFRLVERRLMTLGRQVHSAAGGKVDKSKRDKR